MGTHQQGPLMTLRRALGATWLVLATVFLGCGSHGNFKTQPDSREVGSPMVYLDRLEISRLGQLEGPYYFIQALSPSVVELADAKMKTEQFLLVGLSETGYPPQGQAVKANDEKTPEELAAEQDHDNQMRLYKMNAFKELCGPKPIWLLRLSRRSPAAVYLFMTDSPRGKDGKPGGLATLLNAQALRTGIANIDLATVLHPLFDRMLDSQLAYLVEARRGKTKKDDLWGRFGMKLPPGDYDARLAEIEKRM